MSDTVLNLKIVYIILKRENYLFLYYTVLKQENFSLPYDAVQKQENRLLPYHAVELTRASFTLSHPRVSIRL